MFYDSRVGPKATFGVHFIRFVKVDKKGVQDWNMSRNLGGEDGGAVGTGTSAGICVLPTIPLVCIESANK